MTKHDIQFNSKELELSICLTDLIKSVDGEVNSKYMWIKGMSYLNHTKTESVMI